MYGPHVNQLNLYVQKVGSKLGPVRWTKQGTQGISWKYGEYTLVNKDDVQVGQRCSGGVTSTLGGNLAALVGSSTIG